MPAHRRLIQNIDPEPASVTLDAPKSGPWRYAQVTNFSGAGTSIAVYGAETASGLPLFVAPPNMIVGQMVDDVQFLTFVAVGTAAPLAADQALCAASMAHLPAIACPIAALGAVRAVAITPSDTESFAATKGVYVGAAGAVACTMADGTTVTFEALAAGVVHHLSVTQIDSTGTTATGIVALY